MKKLFISLCMCLFAFSSFAQSIVVTSGTIDFIKSEKVIIFTYTYDDMLVGKMTESEYVEKKSMTTTKKKRARETNGLLPG